MDKLRDELINRRKRKLKRDEAGRREIDSVIESTRRILLVEREGRPGKQQF